CLRPLWPQRPGFHLGKNGSRGCVAQSGGTRSRGNCRSCGAGIFSELKRARMLFSSVRGFRLTSPEKEVVSKNPEPRPCRLFLPASKFARPFETKEQVCGDSGNEKRRRERHRAGGCWQAEDRMGAGADACVATDSQAFHQGTAIEGIARVGVSARNERNRKFDDCVARRWRGHRFVRIESAFDAG